ncbi:MAG TPA: TlyA family RNA methyltransferase [Actinomycetales bacterium]|nr:TlyA family RNA methyltransferase [Actinomycetales bacterium]
MARLDSELVRRGLARARGHAAELVAAGRVLVDGRVAAKPSLAVGEDTRVEIVPGPGPDYVGRGAHKLAGVLDELEATHPPGVVADGLRCLDAGASTGGFTQVLLERGARQVLAVDVGHDQLAPALREDPRVLDLPGTSVRGLTASAIGGPVDLVVGDLSFISLTKVLDDLRRLVRPRGQLVLLVKPQFEVGRRRLGSGGVVRDPALRQQSVVEVCAAAIELGLGVRAVRASRWPGPSGNVEYFVWLESHVPVDRSDPDAGTIDVVHPRAGTTDLSWIESAVRVAVEEGPA